MQLPKGIREQHGRYYADRKVDGRRLWIPLTRVADGREALDCELERLAKGGTPRTIGDLLRRFKEEGMQELAPDTRREYGRSIDARLAPVFGAMLINDLRQKHVARFLEDGRRAHRAVMANRERAVLSAAYEFGMRNEWAELNPCRGVRRNRERPSRIYVTHEQYLDAYRRAPEAVRNLMHIGYLTGLRLSDLIRIRKDWIHDEGIFLTESKTGHRRLIKMTLYLRRALDRAIDYAPSQTPYLLVTARGATWQKWSVQSAWKRLRPGFPFRQIRAKAQTDARQKNVLGHSGQMLQRYTRYEELEPVA
jgi:site-specific recombinase XerD